VNMVRDKSGRMNVDTLGKGPHLRRPRRPRKRPRPGGCPVRRRDGVAGRRATGVSARAPPHRRRDPCANHELGSGRTVELARRRHRGAAAALRGADPDPSARALRDRRRAPGRHRERRRARAGRGAAALSWLDERRLRRPRQDRDRQADGRGACRAAVIDLESATVELLGGSARGQRASSRARTERGRQRQGRSKWHRLGPAADEAERSASARHRGPRREARRPPPGAPNFGWPSPPTAAFAVKDGRIVGVQLAGPCSTSSRRS